jgi:hypothetical protein
MQSLMKSADGHAVTNKQSANGHEVTNEQSADGHAVYSAYKSVERQPVREQEFSS